MLIKHPKRWRLVKLIAVVIGLATVTWFWLGYASLWHLEDRPLKPLAFAPQGDVLATGTLVRDGGNLKPVSPICFLSTINGTEVEPPMSTLVAPPVGVRKQSIPKEIYFADFSPDGSLLAVLQDHDIFQVDFELELVVIVRETGERLINVPIRFKNSMRTSSNIALYLPPTFFSPDGKYLLWVEKNYDFPVFSVRVWDLASRKEKYTLPNVWYPVFSPDGEMIATRQYEVGTSGNELSAVQLWDVSSGALLQTIPLDGIGEGLSSWPSFSPEGRLLAVNSSDGGGGQTVEVFETTTGKRVFKHEAWSPHLLADGRTLFTVKNQDVQLAAGSKCSGVGGLQR